MDRVLSVAMRPKTFGELVGQEPIVTALQNQLRSGRIPHFFIFSGTVGSGKTTMARLLALALQKGTRELSSITLEDSVKYKSYDTIEINAANKTSVDDIRQLIEKLKFKPMQGKCKVVVLDEAHQLSASAQNALLKETEDVPEHVYIMFCTSALGKVIPALQRRAYVVSPRVLERSDMTQLIERAISLTNAGLESTPLVEELLEYDVRSSGLVLQAVEKYISGVPARECVLLSGGSTLDSGDWKSCAPLLATLTKGDAVAVLCSVMGYLKSILLKSSGGSRGINLAKAVETLSRCPIDDHAVLPALISSLLIACEYVKESKRKATAA
jgi:DNA polymerase III subunit gamma/tau